MMNAYRAMLVLIVATFSICAVAQSAPTASRSAFKCKVDGKIVYSDEPCLGAEKIDFEPSKNANVTPRTVRSSDTRRPQPQREPEKEANAENRHALTDAEPAPAEAVSGRARLSSTSQRECRDLESGIARLEREEKEATKPELPRVQSQLFSKRKRFVDLGC